MCFLLFPLPVSVGLSCARDFVAGPDGLCRSWPCWLWPGPFAIPDWPRLGHRFAPIKAKISLPPSENPRRRRIPMILQSSVTLSQPRLQNRARITAMGQMDDARARIDHSPPQSYFSQVSGIICKRNLLGNGRVSIIVIA